MDSAILGWIIISIGLVSMATGVIGGILRMVKGLRRSDNAMSYGLGIDLNALAKLVEALSKAPVWLALVIVGVLLTFLGNTMMP